MRKSVGTDQVTQPTPRPDTRDRARARMRLDFGLLVQSEILDRGIRSHW